MENGYSDLLKHANVYVCTLHKAKTDFLFKQSVSKTYFNFEMSFS